MRVTAPPGLLPGGKVDFSSIIGGYIIDENDITDEEIIGLIRRDHPHCSLNNTELKKEIANCRKSL